MASFAVAALLLFAGAGPARPAERAGCPVRAITGDGPEVAGHLSSDQIQAVAKAFAAQITAFRHVYAAGLEEAFRADGPKVGEDGVDACVVAIVADARGASQLLGGVREAVRSWAQDRAAGVRSWHEKNPSETALRGAKVACYDGINTAEGLGALYYDLAYQILGKTRTSAASHPEGTPSSSRLWPMTIARDLLVEAFADEPVVSALFTAPASPAEIRDGSVLRVPLPSPAPAYRAYLGWLEPGAWPGDGAGASNPLLGAALACIESSGFLTRLNYARPG
jgi:hypothetical protein